jgi:glutathione-independent formaldehyde dehydrogenase
MLLVSVGRLFEKGMRMGTGQTNVKRYNRHLRDLIIEGRAAPSSVVSHELLLDEAPMAYEKFDKRVEGYIKVVLHP